MQLQLSSPGGADTLELFLSVRKLPTCRIAQQMDICEPAVTSPCSLCCLSALLNRNAAHAQSTSGLAGGSDTYILATGPVVVVAGGAAAWAAAHVQARLRGGRGGGGRLQFRRLEVAMQSVQQHKELKLLKECASG